MSDQCSANSDCLISVQEFRGRVTGVKVKPVDTTGAGDAFVSGIINSIASDPSIFQVLEFYTFWLLIIFSS